MLCCEIISVVIDVSIFQILSYNVADFQVTQILQFSGYINKKALYIFKYPKHSEHQSFLIKNDTMTAPSPHEY